MIIILRNLLDNCIKYTQTGRVSVSCRMEEHDLIITIQDTGKGFTPEQVLAINDKRSPFQQKNHSLGLRIILDMIALINAQLILSSQEDEGSTFSIIFDTAQKEA